MIREARQNSGGRTKSVLGQRRGATSMEERGDQIRITATRLFSERGYSGTRLDDIAEELGVTRAALYYYFGRGKQELLELVCASGMDGAEQVLARARATQDPVDALRIFMVDYAAHITSGEARVFFRETSELPADFRRELLRRARRMTTGVADLVRRGVESGAFREDVNPDVAANGLLGTLNWMSQWHHGTARTPQSAEELGAQFAELLLRGVERVPAGSTAGRAVRPA